MAEGSLRSLLRGLRHLDKRSEGALTDTQLLERFIKQRDEAAFEVLVWRHGPLVLGVCRRLLRREQDVEDAFQATFLALVRKAQTILRREAVGAWLYRVAYRVALAARGTSSERAAREKPWADQPGADEDGLLWRDLRPVLDAEVMRLPEKYRVPFVLCCLEGKTSEEAAAQLGCPRGTLLSRLARARERLRWRLARRGVTLSAAALATAATERGLAAVPAGFAGMTINAVLPGAAGTAAAAVSARVAALAEGVLRVMFLTRLKMIALVAVLLALAGAGAGFLSAGVVPGEGSGVPQKKAAAVQPAGGGRAPAGGVKKVDPVQEMRLRAESANNLKQIGLALHNYHDVYQGFPAPAIYGKGLKPLLSWRVAILPYLEQEALYKQFKRDEAWDSPHNMKLLEKMPEIYAPVRGPSKVKGGTYYQAFVGNGAGFEPGKSLRIPAAFPDGTSNSILVVEAGKPVPWTKPDDLSYAPDKALPKLGGQFKGHFNALFADGSVQLLSRNANEQMLRLAITRDDGQTINFDFLLAPLTLEQGKIDLDLLPGEVDRLKEALKKARAEVRKAEADLAKLRELAPPLDPKTQALIEVHTVLQAELERTLRLRDALRGRTQELRQKLEQKRNN